MIGIMLHWYYLPLAIVLLCSGIIAVGNQEWEPWEIGVAICGFALLVRWLP